MLASLLTGLVLTGATLALAEPLGKPLFGADTAALLMMISPVFLLAGLCAVSRGLLWRRLDFRRVSLIEMVGTGARHARRRGPCRRRSRCRGDRARAPSSDRRSPPPCCCAPRRRRCRAGTARALGEIMGFGLPASAAGLTSVGDHQLHPRHRRRAPLRQPGRALLARLPARRHLPGKDQRNHDPAGLPGLLADHRPERAAPLPRAGNADPCRRAAAAALTADRHRAGPRAVALRPALGAGGRRRSRSSAWPA